MPTGIFHKRRRIVHTVADHRPCYTGGTELPGLSVEGWPDHVTFNAQRRQASSQLSWSRRRRLRQPVIPSMHPRSVEGERAIAMTSTL